MNPQIALARAIASHGVRYFVDTDTGRHEGRGIFRWRRFDLDEDEPILGYRIWRTGAGASLYIATEGTLTDADFLRSLEPKQDVFVEWTGTGGGFEQFTLRSIAGDSRYRVELRLREAREISEEDE